MAKRYRHVDIEHLIRSMNSHMPSSRRSLLDHIESGGRTYRTKDGNTIIIGDDEIDALNDICTEIEKMRLLLPIFVSTDASSDNAWKVDGTVETSVVSKILGKRSFREDMVRFYNPDLKLLRSQFPNAVAVLYLP